MIIRCKTTKKRMSGKAYLLYTLENVDNCEQPLRVRRKTAYSRDEIIHED